MTPSGGRRTIVAGAVCESCGAADPVLAEHEPGRVDAAAAALGATTRDAGSGDGQGTAAAEQLILQLRAVLTRIDSGELDASTVLRARIEGAVVALDVVLGADPAAVLDRLIDTS